MKKEKFWNVPNTITSIRLVSTFLIAALIFLNVNFIIVAVLFAIFALTDMIDGRLARKLKQTTKIGAKLDQVADRIFFGGVLTALIINFMRTDGGFLSLFLYSHIPASYFLLIISREIIAFPAFLYLLVSNKPFVKVRTIGKVATVLQAVTICWVIVKMPFTMYPVILTGVFGLLAGVTYWYDVAKTRPVKYVSDKIEEQIMKIK